ncbi:F-box/LRR-repeat protein [Trifolium pratense]|uniref:F-box/LRR-repeat protein n=1 Tax=Trifolium pratense TaxID=57577 RepID=A0A2K3NNH0_TRIPR|nr:F-box/LRR-repeat protein [Trifolium pratense]
MVLSIPEEDRISDLPYEVLEHILSYLPTKDAVATTFLSKRWKSESVWRSQLNLHFDDKTIPDPSAFRQLLYSVITKRDNTLPIHSFHLNSRHDYNTDFYNFVYSSVITRGVQNLSIDHCNITTTKTFILTTLPTFVLTTKTLSVLKLKTIALNEDDPYFEFDLPSLKVLHLESVAFTYDKHIRKLLSACPILEELETKDLTIKRLAKHLQFDVPSLSNLVTADISGGYIVLDWLHNVQHLRIKLRWVNPLLAMFHNLIHMELRFDSSYPAGFKGGRLIKLLQNSPKLQTMIIDETLI